MGGATHRWVIGRIDGNPRRGRSEPVATQRRKESEVTNRTPREAIEGLKALDREIQLLSHTGALLGWDQEVLMPEKAVEERSEQIALLEKLVHERVAGGELAELLAALEADDDRPEGTKTDTPTDAALVRNAYRAHTRATKLPAELVTEIARRVSLAHVAWAKAREQSEFSLFQDHLERLLGLRIEVAERIGYEKEPYDALLDEFEPWMKTETVRSVFADLRPRLVDLVRRIADADQIDDRFLEASFPVADQERFGRQVLADLGYEMDRGRLDVSVHPFTTSLGVDDVRLTTRYNEHYFKTGLFGIIHEAGHGLYELGFGDDIRKTTLADGTSLGIHESQSRFWENVVGRSLPFWRHYYDKLRAVFPSQLEGVDVETFYRSVNKVERSLIRVEADEVTYGLHIMLRFELEQDLIAGKLRTADLPDAWNAKSEELIGVVPTSDAEGVLQDIHWSMGAFGYFPTYQLGNLYAAQFSATMERDLPEMHEDVAEGRFDRILGWLRDRIHRHGSAKTADELLGEVTGEGLNADHYMNYLTQKYGDIYRLG